MKDKISVEQSSGKSSPSGDGGNQFAYSTSLENKTWQSMSISEDRQSAKKSDKFSWPAFVLPGLGKAHGEKKDAICFAPIRQHK